MEPGGHFLIPSREPPSCNSGVSAVKPGTIKPDEDPLVTPPAGSTLEKPKDPPAPPLVPPADNAARTMTLPLPGGGTATVQTSRPLTDAEWLTFTTVVQAMQGSFVDAPTPSTADDI